MSVALKDDDFDVFFDLLQEEHGRNMCTDFLTDFRLLCASGTKIGTAFAHILPDEMRSGLTLAGISPWDSNNWTAIYNAIEFLTGGKS